DARHRVVPRPQPRPPTSPSLPAACRARHARSETVVHTSAGGSPNRNGMKPNSTDITMRPTGVGAGEYTPEGLSAGQRPSRKLLTLQAGAAPEFLKKPWQLLPP